MDGSTAYYVRKIGRVLGCKAGHTGTLDPMATGLVEVLLGSSTKLNPFFTNLEKTYIGRARLGIRTNTGDREGEVLERHEVKIDEDGIRQIAAGLSGELELSVPIYSAVKVKGKALYKYARRGVAVELPKRRIEVFRFDITNIDLPDFEFEARVSKGTYIRSLAERIGDLAGCGAHLTTLRRTKIGDRDISDSITFENVIKMAELGVLGDKIINPIEALVMPGLEVDFNIARQIASGIHAQIDIDKIGTGSIFYVSYSAKLIAVLRKSPMKGNDFEFVRVLTRPEKIEN
ncbi:tRNA pseudouridine(55) synthase TruB [bacterium]|nr:tRNA pseudouridine(55) synthase TruB [bacterium]